MKKNANNPNSYENVMKELEEVNEQLEHDKNETPVDFPNEIVDNSYFKFEYAHESLTERHTAYKRRVSHA